MGFGSTLWSGTKSAGSFIADKSKAAGSFVSDKASSFAKSNVGQMAAQTLGNVEKAVIVIADFSQRKPKVEPAPKPGGGQNKGLGGLEGFDEGLAGSFGASVGSLKALKDEAGNITGIKNTDDSEFDINKDFQKYRFEVPFNPDELTLTGYGGEEMMVQSFSNKDTEGKKEGKEKKGNHKPANRISAVSSHIELNIPLIFDRTNNQDAFYGDKFSLGATNVARGVGKLAKDTFTGESNYSVQKEVEAFTYIMRNKKMHLMTFTWGDMSYQGILNGVNAEYTMFNVNGEPCRAKVTLRLVLLDSDFEDMKRIWVKKYRNNVGLSDQKSLVNDIASKKVH